MRLQHLHLLLTLAKTGSLRASAQILNVSQPALTKALRQLEDEFGTELVVRTPKGVRLAPAGELIATRAATVVREIERAREEVAWHLRHAEAQVTVGVSPVAAILLAPGAADRFGARWPQVKVRLRDALYPRALEQVRAGELDMALGPLPTDGIGRDLVVQPLFDSQAVIVARRSHPLARAKRLVDLMDTAWVLTGPAGGPGDPHNLRFGAKDGRTPQVRLECESFSTLLELMARLDVIAIMPKGFFDRYGPRMDFVHLPIVDALPNTTIYALHRADTPLTLPARRLLEAFVAEARDLRTAKAA
ncbi:LysR substrate-binding domain-containing protein [Variovorax robiniae]|uniref:LysR substrate-binding domain-containing protein n=1 Tax=Variovorax robiniae TaxID=1836199 RepID=A0ABU8XGW0_9BURK